jgi:alkylation response protein AidB-like acyl-CoA dehydrogenase
MDLNFSPEEERFRLDVREFFASHLPKDIQAKVLEGKRLCKEDYSRWHKILYEKGWVAPAWPVEFGGPGWSVVQRHIFNEEYAHAGAPMLPTFGLVMVAPVIMAFGNAAQQQYFLPRILSGEDWWCQGYSEPGAGSDLASLQTRAERQGDHYIVSGQKTWNTMGHFADWIFCLVRTNKEARKQEGISFLLIDMKTPGITVRPIIMLNGEHDINEVWFENVKVPVQNLIGEENKGWTYAKFLLGHERTGIAGVGRSKHQLKVLKDIACREVSGGRPLIEDQRFRDKIAQIELELMALEITNLRVISSERDKRAPGPEASILKIKGTEIHQAISEMKMQAVGHYALPLPQEEVLETDSHAGPVGPDYAATQASYYFNMRKLSIYGGSNEIQKNIISQMILGL